jgi:hypothetical protein
LLLEREFVHSMVLGAFPGIKSDRMRPDCMQLLWEVELHAVFSSLIGAEMGGNTASIYTQSRSSHSRDLSIVSHLVYAHRWTPWLREVVASSYPYPKIRQHSSIKVDAKHQSCEVQICGEHEHDNGIICSTLARPRQHHFL